MARTPNKQETKTFEVTVPQALYDYLGFLAANTPLGSSENVVAVHILTVRIQEMILASEHEKLVVPKLRLPAD